MKILVIGSGGREHAIIHALTRANYAQKITCSPGNAGIAALVDCVDLDTHADIIVFCQTHAIDLVIIGPEQPLVDGLADALRAANISVFGPSAKAAQLEGSKNFTKQLCSKYHIPTAAYATFDTQADALAYLYTHRAPIVIKADGLAAGKGVTVAMDDDAAVAAVRECFSGAFGQAGARVVIEEYMEGEEVSFFALCDGITAIPFCHAQDHKRAYDGDKGPNTGGMGTYSPCPIFPAAVQAQVMREIIAPTVAGLASEGVPYIGVLFAGLMLTKTGPKLIEYNCRFGDPETQVMMLRFNGDLARLLKSCAEGALDAQHLSFSADSAMCVVMAAKGYPASYQKGSVIRNLDAANAIEGVTVYHAGTAKRVDDIVSNGGRVLGVTARATTLKEAQTLAYQAVDTIDWKQGFCRRDIGAKGLS